MSPKVTQSTNSFTDDEDMTTRMQHLQDTTEPHPMEATEDDNRQNRATSSDSEGLFVPQEKNYGFIQSDIQSFGYEKEGELLSDSETEDGDTLVDQDVAGPHYDVTNGSSKDTRKRRGPAAKTAKEYVARLHDKRHQDLKEHIRTEKDKGKRNADGEVEIAPPQPKRRRASSKGKRPAMEQRSHGKFNQNEAIEKTADVFHSLSNVSESASTGAIPASSEQRVTKNVRNKQMFAQTTYGQDNRHRTTQRRDVKEAGKILGYGKVKCFGETSYKIDGMKSKIHDWQLTPVAWMVKRENAEMPPFGGVLADVPGMGKTVVSLSCIIGNPPDKEDVTEWSAATLVVLPSHVVVGQWAEEIEKHLESITKDDVYIYRKSRNNLSVGKIATFKIV